MSAKLSTKSQQITNILASKIGALCSVAKGQNHGEDEIVVEAQYLLKVVSFLQTSKEFELHMLLDICGVDRLGRAKRFDVVYQLLSLTHNKRLRIKVMVNDDEYVPSLTSIFKSAAWYEREVWDLYGIKFSHNDDLRRILTDYGFEGHPLRKDFPLTGYKEIKYDYESQKVVYDDVYLTQEYRDFDAQSPWEGSTNYRLPGDEKAEQ